MPLLPFEQFKDMIIFMFIEQTTIPGRETFWFRHKHLPPRREREEKDGDYLQNDYGIWIKWSVWAFAKYSHFTSIAFLVPHPFFVQSRHFISSYVALQSIFDLTLFISNGTERSETRNCNHTYAGKKLVQLKEKSLLNMNTALRCWNWSGLHRIFVSIHDRRTTKRAAPELIEITFRAIVFGGITTALRSAATWKLTAQKPFILIHGRKTND